MFNEDIIKQNVVGPSGNSYVSGLRWIEREYGVDLEEEFYKDGCSNLLQLLESSKKEPNISEKEIHTRRDRCSHLKKFIELASKFEDVDNSSNLVSKKIKEVIRAYKKDFDKINKEERYKWEAVKWYKEHWDIDALNFGEMVKTAFSKAFNLLTSGNYYAYKMLYQIAEDEPEKVRSLFNILYDESLPLAERFDAFRAGFDEYCKPKNYSSYQDLHAVSVYLFFEYPEKYYIYKYGVWVDFAKNLGLSLEKNNGKHETFKIECSNKLCDKILSLIEADDELVKISEVRLDESCYRDSAHHLLAFDIMFFGSYYQPVEESANGWYPSLKEYDPNISKDLWLKILSDSKTSTPDILEMLKMMLQLGGESSCYNLAKQFGNTHNHYNITGSNFGKRIHDNYNIPFCYDKEDNRYRRYPIPFVGKDMEEDGTWHYVWRIRPELKEALAEMDLSHIDITPKEELIMTDVAKNTILYGPPGTGKTYNTVCYAVAIVENKSLEEIMAEASEESGYYEVFSRYNEYKSQGLIEFTTFHQSYGYEEFIEGIKPVTDSADEDEQTDIKYDIVDGIFKEFCNRVNNSVIKNQENELGLNKNPTVWKVSMWSTGDNPIRTECMENGHIRIGWDDYGPEITSETDFSKFGGRNVLNNFIYKMKVGDIVLSCYSSTTVDAVGVVTGEYEWNGKYEDLNRVRKVNWLVKGINENIVEMNGGTVFTLSSVYKAKVSVADALSIVEKYSPVYANDNVKQQNKVFIIDEINRGNISKIFGELITLVEPSKRIGADEGIKAVLPYSKKPFGIPENVYILGTMNTADRSIATLDTALRRRFDFVEMMPDTKVLEGIEVDGVNISVMLEKMNERIAVLFDREHTIGHAYFIGLKDSPDMETLANIFKNKVIPLLQEYFYEDYERIRLVLADNQVSETEEQFIIAETVDSVALFGNSEIDILDDTKRYIINDNAFENADAYIKIYNI